MKKNEISVNEMKEVINANMELVTDRMKSKFEQMDTEHQYKKILGLIKIKEMRDESIAMNRMAAKVKELFERRGADVQDAQEVIRFCESFIEDCKQSEIARINEEISRLDFLRRKYGYTD